MNVVKEIQRINERELDLQPGSGSWHDEYKDSAYVFIGGLNSELTEGDVITIFSQYGEVADIDMPREKGTGKRRGFAFLMYEDQRSTVLAVDNLNGAQVLGRTLRVDHTKNYKQKEKVDGKWVDRETERLNAAPQLIQDDNDNDSESGDSMPDIDPDDPMRDFMIEQYKEKKAKAKGKSKKHANDTPEERQARKERKRQKKLLKLRSKGETMTSGRTYRSRHDDRDDRRGSHRSRSRSPVSRKRPRSRSLTPRMDLDERDRDRRR